MKKPSAEATKAVRRLLDDLTDRRGLRQAWDEIDEEIQGEIEVRWAEIIDAAFGRKK